MDLRQFLRLYTAEAQEHVRLRQRSLLQLESGAGGAVIEEASRAAHTLKSMSAAMGFADVADLAHSLEDRLADVRSGASGTASSLIDELLAAADAIGAAVDRGIAGGAADAAVRNVIPSAGDVEDVTLHAVASAAQPAPVTSAQPVRIRMGANRIDEIAEAVAELSVLFERLRARAGHDGRTRAVTSVFTRSASEAVRGQFRILSQAGMTTADAVSAVSGRGVGLDVVASRRRMRWWSGASACR
jgi:HPt (histidine-containing phosphotransfer) domain-containing protein